MKGTSPPGPSDQPATEDSAGRVLRTDKKADLTPVFKQYWDVKEQYPDVILLFRIGDFYEMFGRDAETASAALEITLTSRDYSEGERIPMCGIPHHAAERYIARLVTAGHRVAVCDQVEDARFAKNLVRREVTRIITPGIVLEDSMLSAGANNFLVALELQGSEEQRKTGIAVCDVSTGEFAVAEWTEQGASRSLSDELGRLRPSEIVLDTAQRPQFLQAMGGGEEPAVLVDAIRDDYFRRSSEEFLLEHFGVRSLEGFGCAGKPAAVAAAASLLRYLKARQVDIKALIQTLYCYSFSDKLGLDRSARRNLELTETSFSGDRSRSLLSVLNFTCTAPGARLLRRWLEEPLVNAAEIRSRHDLVEEFVSDSLLRGDLRQKMRPIADIERLATRCAAGHASPRDLAALRATLQALPELLDVISTARGEVAGLAAGADALQDLYELLAAALVDDPPGNLRDGNVIRDGYDEHLDETRSRSSKGKEWIAELETRERERTGIKSLKVGFNNVFGYFIEITRANIESVPSDYIRKQTLANAERFYTPELKDWEAQILGADERIQAIEQRLFTELRTKLGRESERMRRAGALIAQLDTLASLAEAAVRHDYARPQVDDGSVIEIRDGRHPVVERFGEEPFIPNDTDLDGTGQRILIITGPNMAGKSTYLRQVALIVLMAQAGSFVPASSARIGVVDRIFTRVGAHDDLAAGQSTFMVEMTETAAILNHATDRSLVVLDEVGRGTSTYDGLAIAWSVVEALHEIGCRTLFATHYHHLNSLPERLDGVCNYRVAVREEGEQIIWLRRIVPGGTDRSYGIHVARVAGLPSGVIRRASAVLSDLEASSAARDGIAPTRVSAERKKVQLTLFEVENHPVLEELRSLDINSLTPVEALMRLQQLHQQAQQ